MTNDTETGDTDRLGPVVNELNEGFDYGEKGQDLEFWYNMAESGVREIREHLDDNENMEALEEFADLIFVGHKAVMEHIDEHDEFVIDRAENIMERQTEVELNYSAGYGRNQRYVGTDSDQ